MWDLIEEVSKATQILGVNVRLLPQDESRILWIRVAELYAGGSSKWPLWEHLQDDIGVQLGDAQHRLSELLGLAPALLLFDPHDAKEYFEFESASDILRVLAECFRFEFYVTDRAFTFLLCVNHHDFLIAAGAAKHWVTHIERQRHTHGLKNSMSLLEIERRLAAVLSEAKGLLPEEQIADMRSLNAAGEPGVALENFCEQLYEYDVPVPQALCDELKALGSAMGIDESYYTLIRPQGLP